MADFSEGELEQLTRSSINDLQDNYDQDYWRRHRRNKEFPAAFWQDLADHDWLGIALPEEYGGQGMGIQEVVWLLEELGSAESWTATLEFIITPIFGGETLVAHGTEEQKSKWLPRIADGEARWALGVTEADAGLNTTNISTFAERDGDVYVVNGEKMWTSAVHEADRITLLVRTLPRDEVDCPSHGMSILLVDPESDGITYDEIPLDLYTGDRTFMVDFDEVRVPASNLVGEEHQGLTHIFDMLNTERITHATQMYALGRYALEKATDYANDREVFGQPIGSHQAIQHPLAQSYADLKTARLMIHKAAWLYDNDEPAGEASNIANLKASQAAWSACEAAMTTFGGMSASSEIGVAKAWEYVRHGRTIPVSEEMIRNFIGERQLGLPKSY
jgi:acyl-CoA dehydrogenase